MATISNNSYKARFCNMYFPDLCKFITKFNISLKNGYRNESSNLRNYNNDLGMNFLLASYDKHDYKELKDEELNQAKKNVWNRKTKTHWDLGTVLNADLMRAVDEYFEITSKTTKLKEQQDILMECLLDPLKDRFKYVYIKPEDITLRTILSNLGVLEKGKKLEIGSQIEELKNFIRCAKNTDKDYIEEGLYITSLNLFKELRNLQTHELEEYDGLKKMIFHKFIAFTYIGVIYLCRRLWEDYKSNLAPKYSLPSMFKSSETIDIVVETKGKQKITSCSYSYGDDTITPQVILPNKSIQFPLEVRRYNKANIKIVCDNYKEDVITKEFKFNYWNRALFILIPDADTEYHVVDVAGEGHEDLDSRMSRIINGLSDQMSEEIKNTILQTLGNFTPSFEEIKETGDEMILMKVQEDLELLSFQVDELNKDYKQSFDSVKDNIEELNNRLKDSYNSKLLESIGRIGDDVSYIRRFVEFKVKLLKYLPLLFSIFTFISFAFFDYSLWLWPLSCYQTLMGSAIIILGLPIFSLFMLLWFKGGLNKKTIKLLNTKDWCIVNATTILLFAVIPIIPNRIKKFDMGSSSHNAKAVEFMENSLKYMPIPDEPVRIQLINYYLQFNEQPQRAMNIAAPMITDKTGKYKDGLVACAEAYFRIARYETNDSAQKELFKETQKFIDKYYGLTKDSLPSLLRLEGIMRIFGNKDLRDYTEGGQKLEKAYYRGDAEAAYYIGYIYSHNSWFYKSSDSIDYWDNHFDYNLWLSVQMLRKAGNELPKADIELGKIYANLNINDSARYYYMRAIERTKPVNKTETIGNLHKEALYRMALLCESVDKDTLNEYLIEAADAYNYEPAKFHKAIRIKRYGDAIAYYYGYKGYQYIPPVAFIHIKLKNYEKALQIMQSAHPKGNFNLDFINATQLFLSEDSVKKSHKWEIMRKSASKGCLFAEMLCISHDVDELITKIGVIGKHVDFDKETSTKMIRYMERLDTISNEIPFANTIISLICMQCGWFEKADYYSQRAISNRIPSSAYIVGLFPTSYIEDFKKYMDISPSRSISNSIQKKKELFEKCLRIVHSSEMKEKFIFFAIDFAIDKAVVDYKAGLINYIDLPIEQLQFWSDVAIANHSFYSELRLYGVISSKSIYGLYDGDLQRLLIEAMLNDLPREDNGNLYSVSKSTCHFLSREIYALNLYNKVCKIYDSDQVIKDNILSIPPVEYYCIDFPYKDIRHKRVNFYSETSELLEFGDIIGDNVFDEPL